MRQLDHCPLPWKVSESVGGKTFMYDANGKVIVIPNMSATDRKPDELRTIYRMIVNAVNGEYEAWRRFDSKPK